MLLAILNIIPIALFVGIGLLIKYKKAYWLISGYNTMSAEKKKKVDTAGLGRVISNMCFALAALFVVSSVLAVINFENLSVLAILMIFPIIMYTLISAQKYDGNTRRPDGTMKTGSKIMIGSLVGFLALIFIVVTSLIFSGSKPADYSVNNGVLEISGMYGQQISINRIDDLELRNELPHVLMKTNGAALGSKLKGNFRLSDVGAAKLFVDASKPPFIYLTWNSQVFFLNCEDSEKTYELYNMIREEQSRSADVPEAGPLEKAVGRAVKAQGESYMKGEVSTEGHVILDKEESKGSVKVYTVASVANFGFENGIFTPISGSGAIPTVITFTIKQGDELLLVDYKEPLDGAGYSDSIKKMFPQRLWDSVLKTQSYPELKKQQEVQARDFLKKIGREAIINIQHVEKKPVQINVEAKNKLFSEMTKFDHELNNFPYWIGTKELVINGARYIYETIQGKTVDDQDLIIFKKSKEDGSVAAEYHYKIAGTQPQLIYKK